MIKTLNFQLNYIKLYKRLIKLICLKNNRSFKEEKISTLDFWWIFFLNDLKNITRSFLFQMRNKIKQDLFLVNELNINWLLISEWRVILLFMSRWEIELLLTSELRTELLLVSNSWTELLLVSELKMRLKRSYFVNFKREIFFLLIKIINLDEKLTTIIKTEEEKQDENIVFKIDINDVIMKSWQTSDDEVLT